tara:strand:- start:119 stop:571 length:453 start_codon:yes stop_codon:yes gene_type:complete
VYALIIRKEPDRDDSFVAMGSNVSFTFVLVENIVSIITELILVVNNRGIVTIIIITPPNVNFLALEEILNTEFGLFLHLRPCLVRTVIIVVITSFSLGTSSLSFFISVREVSVEVNALLTVVTVVFELFVKVILLHSEKILQVHQVLPVD